MKWRELTPDPGMVAALDAAGPRKPHAGQTGKRQWGTAFANACAVMFANGLRSRKALRGLEIRPLSDGSGTEALTGVGGRGRKKVDIIASSLAAGLQVAISLKAENFASQAGTYGKNLTNRLYELQDEVRAIHAYQPYAYIVGVLFLPLAATIDRPKRSSFERAVAKIRARTGRTDRSAVTQLHRLDRGFIGLYVPGDDEVFARGVARYFDVETPPPLCGRPLIDTTLTLDDVIGSIVGAYREDAGDILEHAAPEED